jgi:Domain of unknown function (DUF4405)
MSARARLFVDVLLFGAFAAAYYPLKTGLPMHEWLCLALLAPAGLHLVLNWDWLERVFSTFFGRLRRTTRVNFTVDVLLFVATVSVMLSGFLVSRVLAHVFGYTPTADARWYRVHSLAANATVLLVALHLLLHWKWVKKVVRTRILGSPARVARPGAPSLTADNRPAWLSSPPNPIPVQPLRRVAESGSANAGRVPGGRRRDG